MDVDEFGALLQEALECGEVSPEEIESAMDGIDLDGRGCVGAYPDDVTACGILDLLWKKKTGGGAAKAEGGKGLSDALSRWKKLELSPAVELRVWKGHNVKVENVGTEAAPVWKVTPVVSGLADDGAGVLPLLLAAPAVIKAVKKGAERRIKLKTAPWKTSVAPGAPVVLGTSGDCEAMIDSDGYSEEP